MATKGPTFYDLKDVVWYFERRLSNNDRLERNDRALLFGMRTLITILEEKAENPSELEVIKKAKHLFTECDEKWKSILVERERKFQRKVRALSAPEDNRTPEQVELDFQNNLSEEDCEFLKGLFNGNR